MGLASPSLAPFIFSSKIIEQPCPVKFFLTSHILARLCCPSINPRMYNLPRPLLCHEPAARLSMILDMEVRP